MDRKSLISFGLSVLGPILVLVFVRPVAPLILVFPFAFLLVLVFPATVLFYAVAIIQFPAYSAVWYIARKMTQLRNPGWSLVAFHVVVALVSFVIVASVLGQ